MAERYQLAVCVADAQAATKPRIRFALLGHEPMIHPERFGEIVAANRGADRACSPTRHWPWSGC